MNHLFLRLLAQKKRILPRKLWRKLLGEIAVDGAPIDPGTLSPISMRFAEANAELAERFPALTKLQDAPEPGEPWTEADPTRGFRTTQYLLSFMHRIDKATREERKAKAADLARINGHDATNAFTLTALVELARHARAVVANDSGPMHVMAAAAVPVFGLFGPSDWRRNHALGQRDHVIACTAVDPAYAGSRTGDCLASISPALVCERLEAAGAFGGPARAVDT